MGIDQTQPGGKPHGLMVSVFLLDGVGQPLLDQGAHLLQRQSLSTAQARDQIADF